MTDIRKNLIDGCSELNDDHKTIKVNNGYIIENLLLFDQYILNSIRLKELPTLVKLFGIEGLNYLFDNGALKLFAKSLTIGQTGQTKKLRSEKKNKVLPKGYYSFSAIRQADKKRFLDDCLKEIEKIDFINKNEKERLKSMVYNNLIYYSSEAGEKILNQLIKDLRHNDFSIKIALTKILQKEKQIKVNPESFTINICQIDDVDFKVESDLQKIILTDINEYHNIMGRALLTIGGRNQKIYNMKNFNSLTSFREDEVQLFSSKLDFLAASFNPNNNKEIFKKILEIKDFPVLSNNFEENNFNVDTFLKIRESKEFKEFQSWLWSINEVNEKELEERVNSYKQKLGELLRTPIGKTLRWVTNMGMGFAGPILSETYGLLDSFIIDKVLKVDGAIVFINRKLPSIFKN